MVGGTEGTEHVNPVIEAIRTRRTVKKFDPSRVPTKEEILVVLEAANWAPNHHLTEPWRFVVLSGDARAKLGEVLSDALSRSSPGVAIQRLESERAKPLGAPVILAIIASPKTGENIVPQEELVAAGAALENALLAAHSLGLATSVRTGLHSYGPEVKRFLGMTETESLVGLVYLGTAMGVLPQGFRKPLDAKVLWRDS